MKIIGQGLTPVGMMTREMAKKATREECLENAQACTKHANDLENATLLTRDLLPWDLLIGKLRMDAAFWREQAERFDEIAKTLTLMSSSSDLDTRSPNP